MEMFLKLKKHETIAFMFYSMYTSGLFFNGEDNCSIIIYVSTSRLRCCFVFTLLKEVILLLQSLCLVGEMWLLYTVSCS